MHFYNRIDSIKARVSTVAIALEFIAEEYEIPVLNDCAKVLTSAKADLIDLKAQEGALELVGDLRLKESQ